MIKEFFLKKMLMAKGVPESQINMIMGLMQKDPALFKKIADEVQQKVKAGKSQQQAMLEVLPKYQNQLRNLMHQ